MALGPCSQLQRSLGGLHNNRSDEYAMCVHRLSARRAAQWVENKRTRPCSGQSAISCRAGSRELLLRRPLGRTRLNAIASAPYARGTRVPSMDMR